MNLTSHKLQHKETERSTSIKPQLLGWIGAVQKDLKSIVLTEFVYDCLSRTTRYRQATDDTVQER